MMPPASAWHKFQFPSRHSQLSHGSRRHSAGYRPRDARDIRARRLLDRKDQRESRPSSPSRWPRCYRSRPRGDLRVGTAAAILKAARISPEEFRKLL